MTSEDVLKFCEKGQHVYEDVDILQSIKSKSDLFYVLKRCNVCPSQFIKRV